MLVAAVPPSTRPRWWGHLLQAQNRLPVALAAGESLVHGRATELAGRNYHFNAWGKQGAWKNLWLTSLRLHRRTLGLSSVQLDGSHTLAKNGEAAIGYQGREAGRTTNALFLADN